MSEKYIIDRVEGNYVIAQKENEEMYEIPLEDIKGDFKEGDILVKMNRYFEIDEVSTFIRRKQIDDVMRDMWKE
ncbi:DUF3006 domain-containing protein [Clostridium sp.]|uniref:DUF3006 domain-containing protein n=1 Tax=Clostridium sp. TaxID=1506 RepID=UPI002843B393|nr:DUF3006 domain-containing protein [Clostridium sp.]MDR3593481.1 DUF3006 domain-containing protein [Clostridium sp.]